MGKLNIENLVAWPQGVRATRIRRSWFERIAALPPSLSLDELADRLQTSYPKAQRWAHFFGYAILDGRRERAADWAGVDWSLRDAEIARQLGVSRERARQVRLSSRAGLCAERAVADQFASFVAANGEQLGGVTVAGSIELSRLDVPWSVARRILRAAEIDPFRAAKKWGELDWRLPNRDLAIIFGLDARRVAGIRAHLKVGPALWDVSGARTINDPKYRAALAKARKVSQRKPKFPSRARRNRKSRGPSGGK